MQLTTTRFGTIDIDEEQIISFTQPIIGFQDYRRFVLLPGPEGSVVSWLQSADAGDLAFLVMDPRVVTPDYTVDLSPAELEELAVTSVAELEVYTLVVVPQDATQVRTNLRAPIVVNPKGRLAKQTVLERSDYPIQFFLGQAQPSDEEHREVEHARSDA